MPDLPETIRQSDLLHCLVLDRRTVEWGRVEAVWMHPDVHLVLGFISQSGRRGREKFAFNLRQIHRVEVERLMVDSDPTPTDTETVALLETLIGYEIWNDAGNKIGKIIDCCFNLKTGTITDYLFRAEGLRGLTGSVYRLPPKQILKFGNNRVRVAQRTADQFLVDRVGIDQKLSQVTEDLTEHFQDRYAEVNAELQSFSTQTQEQLQHLKVKVGRQVQDLTEQATRKARGVAQQVQEELSLPILDRPQSSAPWLGRLQAKARSLSETLQEELHPLAEQVQDKLKPRPPRSSRQSPLTGEGRRDRIPAEDLDDDQPWI